MALNPPFVAHVEKPAGTLRWWLRVWSAVGSITAAYVFSHIVAAGDRRVQLCFFVVAGFGLFIVVSGLADQLRRKRHER